VSLEYQAVGFGSHHWLATDAGGGRVFATVDKHQLHVTELVNLHAGLPAI